MSSMFDKFTARAEAMLTLTPTRMCDVASDGITAALYRPETDAFPGKGLIVVGGGEGIFPMTRVIAEYFCQQGMTALALAYWIEPGLPDSIVEVPLEFVRDAARALAAEGCEQVGIWGISKGGELALSAGAAFPGEISCVVAASPIDVVCQGIHRGAAGIAQGSSWSLGGRALPYLHTDFSKARIVRDMLTTGSLNLRSCYTMLEGDGVPEEARIRVENIAGPVLLLSASQDTMWPAEQACKRMMRVLDAAGHPYEHLHFNYPTVSHYVLPLDLNSARMYATERRHPEQCSAERAESTRELLEFLRRW